MGTDIHWVMEVRHKADDPWVGVLASDIICGVPAGQRFYEFFSIFGLRGEAYGEGALALRELPDDRSSLAKDFDLVGEHSFTWATLDEFHAAYAGALIRSGEAFDARDMFGPRFSWWRFEKSHGDPALCECRLIIGFDS